MRNSPLPSWARWALPPALLVAVLLAFAPALAAGFLHYDDDLAITGNRHLRGLGPEQLEWMFTTNWMGPYQPLAWLSLAVDQQLYGPSAPSGWHATSVLLHALAALAFYALALRVLARAAPEHTGTGLALAAVLAALFFAVHPLRVESVVWLTERRDVLFGLFAILSALAWTRAADRAEREPPGARRVAAAWALAAAAVCLFLVSVERGDVRLSLAGPGWLGLGLAAAALALSALLSSRAGAYHASLALLALALASKGLAVVVPAALCVLDAWPFGRRPALRLVLEKAPFWALAAVFAVLAVWGQSRADVVALTWEEHDLAERVLQACYGLAYYPARTLVPVGLAPIYELPAQVGLARPFLAPLIAVPVFAAGLFLLRRRWPGALPAFVAFALMIAPVLGFTQRGPQLVADRYSYLACLPFALLIGGLVLSRRPGIALGCIATWLVIGGSLTSKYATAWQSSSSLWEHTQRVAPDSFLGLYLLGTERERQGRLDEARDLLDRAYELHQDPRCLLAQSLVSASLAEAEPEQAERHRREALEYSRRALVASQEAGAFTPEYRLNYGTQLWNAGRLEDALEHLEWYVTVEPASFRGRFHLGRVLLYLDRADEAVQQLEAAVALEPERADAREALARALAAR